MSKASGRDDVKKGTVFVLGNKKKVLICTELSPVSNWVRYIVEGDTSINSTEFQNFVGRFDIVQHPNDETIAWADEVVQRLGGS